MKIINTIAKSFVGLALVVSASSCVTSEGLERFMRVEEVYGVIQKEEIKFNPHDRDKLGNILKQGNGGRYRVTLDNKATYYLYIDETEKLNEKDRELNPRDKVKITYYSWDQGIFPGHASEIERVGERK